MKSTQKLIAIVVTSALPLLAEAHPGHDGVPVHEFQILWVLLGILTVGKYSFATIRRVLRRDR